MTLTRADIADAVCVKLGLSKIDSTQMVDTLLEIIKRTLASGDNILTSRFGTFCVRDKRERRGRNPHTTEDMILRATRVVTFRCSGVLGVV